MLPQMRILWVKLGGLWPINVGERIRSHSANLKAGRVRTLVEERYSRASIAREFKSRCKEVIAHAG